MLCDVTVAKNSIINEIEKVEKSESLDPDNIGLLVIKE